jgi:hypothetical protein
LGRLKSVFGVAGAVIPIGYCGYLLYYFLDLSGSVKDAWDTGLGPTMLGLGVVALLFCIPFVFKLVRLFGGPRSPRSGGGAPADDDDDDDARAAAADAIVARYLAQRSAEAASNPPPAISAQQSGGPASRPSFGRKSG